MTVKAKRFVPQERYRSTTDSFWAKVDKRGPNECWNWTGWKIQNGYGRMQIADKKVLATHVSLRLHGCQRPSDDLHALHSCDNPSCVNPSHLRWGTRTDNMRDKVSRGRSNMPKGERSATAKLTFEQCEMIRAFKGSGAEAARAFGISATHAKAIRRGLVRAEQ